MAKGKIGGPAKPSGLVGSRPRKPPPNVPENLLSRVTNYLASYDPLSKDLPKKKR